MKSVATILIAVGVLVAGLVLVYALANGPPGVAKAGDMGSVATATPTSTPTPTPTPTATPKVFKVVPIKFCILSDGVNTDTAAADDGRFNQEKRLKALRWKSLVFSQCRINFKPQGYIVIDDPGPPSPTPTPTPTPTPPGTPIPTPTPPGWGPGSRGDVLEPANASPTPTPQPGEWQQVKNACDNAIAKSKPEDAKEKLTDILIRRFVDKDGNPSTGWAGASDIGTCDLPRPSAKPMSTDPDVFGATNFATILAHEDGHALGLPHNDTVVSLIMNTNPYGHRGLTPAECEKVWKQAEKYSAHYKKYKSGERVDEKKPVTRESVDAIGDAPHVWIDIMDANAVTTAEDTLALDVALAGLLPDDIAGLDYVFMADLDNDTGTGGSPPVAFSHSFVGADMFAEIAVTKAAGVPSVTAVVKRFEAGQWVEVVDPRIEADLVTLSLSPIGGGGSFPAEDVVAFELPVEILPLPLAEGYRVGSFAFDGVNLDEAPIVDGSITEYFDPTSIVIDPVTAAPGSSVTVTGHDFNPNSTVDISVGTVIVANAPTDGTGAFTADFTVPAFSDETFIFNAEWGEYVAPVLAVDTTVVKVGEQYEKKADSVILQLPIPPGGTVELLADGTDSPAAASGSAASRDYTAPLAAAVAAFVALAGGGWYVRRRWLR